MLPTQAISQIGLTIFAVAVGLVTLFLFPIVAYFSAALYGLPAAVFLLLGYLIAINIFSTNPKTGIAFAVGFIPPVVLCLLMFLRSVPLSVILSLLPVASLWGFHNIVQARKRHKRSV